jgi:hypothetical protein
MVEFRGVRVKDTVVEGVRVTVVRCIVTLWLEG